MKRPPCQRPRGHHRSSLYAWRTCWHAAFSSGGAAGASSSSASRGGVRSREGRSGGHHRAGLFADDRAEGAAEADLVADDRTALTADDDPRHGASGQGPAGQGPDDFPSGEMGSSPGSDSVPSTATPGCAPGGQHPGKRLRNAPAPRAGSKGGVARAPTEQLPLPAPSTSNGAAPLPASPPRGRRVALWGEPIHPRCNLLDLGVSLPSGEDPARPGAGHFPGFFDTLQQRRDGLGVAPHEETQEAVLSGAFGELNGRRSTLSA